MGRSNLPRNTRLGFGKLVLASLFCLACTATSLADELSFERCYIELYGVEKNYVLLFFGYHQNGRNVPSMNDSNSFLKVENATSINEVKKRIESLWLKYKYKDSVTIEESNDGLEVTFKFRFVDSLVSQIYSIKSRGDGSVFIKKATESSQLPASGVCDWDVYGDG